MKYFLHAWSSVAMAMRVIVIVNLLCHVYHVSSQDVADCTWLPSSEEDSGKSELECHLKTLQTGPAVIPQVCKVEIHQGDKQVPKALSKNFPSDAVYSLSSNKPLFWSDQQYWKVILSLCLFCHSPRLLSIHLAAIWFVQSQCCWKLAGFKRRKFSF